jgi:hypothetical protein
LRRNWFADARRSRNNEGVACWFARLDRDNMRASVGGAPFRASAGRKRRQIAGKKSAALRKRDDVGLPSTGSVRLNKNVHVRWHEVVVLVHALKSYVHAAGRRERADDADPSRCAWLHLKRAS